MSWSLLGSLARFFQCFQIEDQYMAAIELQHPFRLQPAEIAGDEFAHRSDLRSQLLVAGGQGNLDAFAGAFALLLRQSQEERREPVTHRCK